MVLGATPNPSRYAFSAVEQLHLRGHEVVPIGIRQGTIHGIPIINEMPIVEEVDTVTLYLNAGRQRPYYDYILQTLRPRRIIFNPGTENYELLNLAREAGIETEMGCTLVMLAIQAY
ncbi:MAG: CoA-binding protein [Saprospirales bacterium]|nr:CoA-binding protein [Saprospirales bacterium]